MPGAGEIRGLTIEQVRPRLRAGQDDSFLYAQLLHLTPSVPKPGALASEFEQKLWEHPSDERLLYLYGRALIGKNTPEAIVQLNRAVTVTSVLPWPYAALAEVYASRNFADEGKLLANVRAYRRLCPTSPDGFGHLDKVTDAEAEAAGVGWRIAAADGKEHRSRGRKVLAAAVGGVPRHPSDGI